MTTRSRETAATFSGAFASSAPGGVSERVLVKLGEFAAALWADCGAR